MVDSFFCEGLTLTPHLVAALGRRQIATPSAIQAAAIPVLLAGRQAVLQSGTGTGKTLAYVLPLLQRAAAEPTFRAVIMAPSPELAVQILRTVEDFKGPHVTALGLTGGGNTDRQKDRLKKHPQLLVGTPGRLLELLFAKKIKTAQVKAWVLDEIDAILTEDNDRALRELLSRPECAPQLICASASYGMRATKFIADCMAADRVLAKVDDAPHQSHIRHVTVSYDQRRKDVALLVLLKKLRIQRSIVFVNKAPHVAHLFRVLDEAGVPVVTLSAERDKLARQTAMQALRGGQPCILIATDAAARGLDIEAMDWVVHFEMARTASTYLHRAGRTGRAGREGTSVVMLAADEQNLVRQYEKELHIKFERQGTAPGQAR